MRKSVAVSFSVVLASGVATTLLVAALVAQPKPAEAAFPGINGRIAFSSNRPGSGFYDIYTMSFAGENVKHLTTGRSEEVAPAFSPDGKRIAYWGGDRRKDIFVVDTNGSDQRRVTTERRLPGDPKADYDPAFSPGGHRIVFVRGSGQRDSDYDLYTINEDGTGLRRVFDSTKRPREPSWSPDGTKIAFEYGGRDTRVATVRPDGTNLAILRPGNSPDWSPDGKRIAFSDYGEIYTMKAGGTDVRAVTDSSRSHRAVDPAFSPGGGKIAFADYRDGDGEIYTIGVDGVDEKKLTRNEETIDYDPAWQPVQ